MLFGLARVAIWPKAQSESKLIQNGNDIQVRWRLTRFRWLNPKFKENRLKPYIKPKDNANGLRKL
jgi:hypothetical protein